MSGRGFSEKTLFSIRSLVSWVTCFVSFRFSRKFGCGVQWESSRVIHGYLSLRVAFPKNGRPRVEKKEYLHLRRVKAQEYLHFGIQPAYPQPERAIKENRLRRQQSGLRATDALENVAQKVPEEAEEKNRPACERRQERSC